jgi:hypothetical protein
LVQGLEGAFEEAGLLLNDLADGFETCLVPFLGKVIGSFVDGHCQVLVRGQLLESGTFDMGGEGSEASQLDGPIAVLQGFLEQLAKSAHLRQKLLSVKGEEGLKQMEALNWGLGEKEPERLRKMGPLVEANGGSQFTDAAANLPGYAGVCLLPEDAKEL